MPRKPQPIITEPVIIERKGIPGYLATIVSVFFDGNMSAFARFLGVSRQAVFQFIAGENLPREETLRKLGLETVFRVNKSLIEMEPAKGKGKK